MAARPGAPIPRDARLDVLRGAAILMVLLLHFSLTYRPWNSGVLASLLGHDWTLAVLGNGNFGVTMFFVVSGFLITTNAAERAGSLGALRLRDFYVRRFARIAPCLLAALAIITTLGLCGLGFFAPEGAGSWRVLLLGTASVLCFVHNILMQRWGYFDYALNVYWSLSVEEVFYLAFPIVCLVLRRQWLIAIPCLLCVAVAPAYRAAHANDDIRYLYANPACFDAISIGCLTAMLARCWRPLPRLARLLQIGGWATLVIAWPRGFEGANLRFSFTIIALATAAIILAGTGTPAHAAPRSAAQRTITWLGRHSYELYLFHIIVLGLMRNIVPGQALALAWQAPWLLTFLLVSAGAAATLARAVGDPANAALRRMLAPGRPGPAPLTASRRPR